MDEHAPIRQVCNELSVLTEIGIIESVDRDRVVETLEEYEYKYVSDGWEAVAVDDQFLSQLVHYHLDQEDYLVSYDSEAIYGHRSYELLIDRYAAVAEDWLNGISIDMEGVVYEEDINITISINGSTVTGVMRDFGDWADTERLNILMNDVLAETGATRRFYPFQVVGEVSFPFIEPSHVKPLYGFLVKRYADVDYQWREGGTAECCLCAEDVALTEAWPHNGEPAHPDCRIPKAHSYPTKIYQRN